ncbi:heterokaryon incompatibility protein [Podospora aff. communis PSN243]|uniref:Heterokaryon incompatibility protein n=1 Tax=Podospora aff. communis PSN243 TaxID=3040156 RepID=A0AAV9GZE3_9PEZI|nr:heterokaryon incompatibility protein [Podospora aff. communis PSN243]
MSLCRVCDRLDIKDFVDWEKTLEDVPHHRSLEQLEQAAASGCPLCILIFNELTRKLASEEPLDPATWKASPITLRGVQYVVDDEDTEPGGIFWIKARCDRAGPLAYAYFSLYPDPEGIPIPEDIVIGRKVLPPQENFNLLRQWIQHCETNHSACAASGPLPTRVINVGQAGEDFVRLEETSPDQTDRYMTLSHCWGPTPHLVIRTTKATLPEHLQRIPLTALTNTFRDAVHVTRAVGMKYVWIDSLCIVQDDADDWARESAKMGFIYANSYLTVAAAASPDSTGGCFHHNQGDKPALQPARIKCTTPDGLGHVFLRPRLGDFLTLHQSPLHTRAWVKQERILSPRTIHYDTDQMLWECRESRACESGVPESAFVTQRRIWDGRLHFGEGEQQESTSRRAFWWDWYDLVESYTTHGLTKGEDKLPALSGLATMLERASGGGDRYVAGLWRDHLPFGLLWRKYKDWMKPAPTYRAPTWSWSAWDGLASFYNEADLEGYTLRWVSAVEGIEAVVKPSGLDPKGRLSSGFLKVTGQLKAADERMDPSVAGYQKLPGVMESLNLTVDYLTTKGVIFGLAFFDEEYRPGGGPVYCLRLALVDNESGDKMPSLFLALLLQPTGVNGEYRRIGIGEQREVGTGRYEGPLSSQSDFFAGVPKTTITVV